MSNNIKKTQAYKTIYKCNQCNKSWQLISGKEKEMVDYFPEWISYDKHKICPNCKEKL